MHTSLSLHFIDVQCLDMFRALLAHPQEALHGHRIGGYCEQLQVWVGLKILEDINTHGFVLSYWTQDTYDQFVKFTNLLTL
jgi:hypothetical protein